MLRMRFEGGGQSDWPRSAALAVVAVILAATTLGCCSWYLNNCYQPKTHSMAFGATAAGCSDGCECVCPVPDILDVNQGDKIWFVNTSKHKVTLTVPAGTFDVGTQVVIAAEDAVLVTVEREAPPADFFVDVEVASPGLMCPALAHPRMIIRTQPTS